MEPSTSTIDVPTPRQSKENLVPGAGVKACPRDPKTGQLQKKKAKELSREVEDELAAMRRVSATPAEDDVSYQHQRLRKWLDEDVRGFMARLAKLADESRVPAKAVAGDEAGPGKADEGTARAAELWERLLAEHGEERE